MPQPQYHGQGPCGAFDLDVKQLGRDLFIQDVDRLTKDTECTSNRKFGKLVVEHISVHGGEFNCALGGEYCNFR